MATATEGNSEFREFVLEHDQPIYDFCYYMMGESPDVDDVVLKVFRTLGDRYRRLLRKKGVWEPLEHQISLYKLAWAEIRSFDSSWNFYPHLGRDTRKMRESDEDILKKWGPKAGLSPQAEKRLLQVEVEYRAPLVLRDLLGLEDEPVMRILELRWGVYRHRLHRGRMEFLGLLRGMEGASHMPSFSLSPAKVSS